jgi:hypothetical protein
MKQLTWPLTRLKIALLLTPSQRGIRPPLGFNFLPTLYLEFVIDVSSLTFLPGQR